MVNETSRTILQSLKDSPKDKYELADEVEIARTTVKDHISRLRDDGHTIRWSREESKYHLGEDIHVAADEIPLEDIAQELDGGETISNLAERFNTDTDTIRALFQELEAQGYAVESKNTGREKLYFLPTEVDKRFSLPESDHYRIGLISDTHLGSDAEHLHELEEFYDRLQERGITRVFHCGDVSDGWNVHTGHLNEIKDEAAGWGNLKEYVIRNYPERDTITTHFIEGNHDNKFYNRNNIRFGRLIANRRPDLHYCGNSQATFNLTSDIDLELIHPSGGKPYTTGYRLQTLYRERNPDERPSIAGVGHLHGSMYAQTEGVHGLYAGAWKGTTTYGKRKGHQAKIGGWILDIDINNGSISQIVPQWHGWDERNTSNRYEMQDL